MFSQEKLDNLRYRLNPGCLRDVEHLESWRLLSGQGRTLMHHGSPSRDQTPTSTATLADVRHENYSSFTTDIPNWCIIDHAFGPPFPE